MKNFLLGVFSLVFWGAVTIPHVEAIVVQPMAGRIITIPGVTCPGAGGSMPFFVAPMTLSGSIGPFAPLIMNPVFPTIPGAFIKGNFIEATTPLCATTSSPPVPFPVFPLVPFQWGTSKSPF